MDNHQHVKPRLFPSGSTDVADLQPNYENLRLNIHATDSTGARVETQTVTSATNDLGGVFQLTFNDS